MYENSSQESHELNGPPRNQNRMYRQHPYARYPPVPLPYYKRCHKGDLIKTTESRGRGYDPLTAFRPGPLAPEYNPGYPNKQDNDKAAKAFMRRELDGLSGHVHVIYESIRKFGRFDIQDGKIKMQREESEKDYIDGLSRLWQVGDGYIYVRHYDSRKGEYFNVYVFHVDHITYNKLEASDAASVISGDPLWREIGKSRELRFI